MGDCLTHFLSVLTVFIYFFILIGKAVFAGDLGNIVLILALVEQFIDLLEFLYADLLLGNFLLQHLIPTCIIPMWI